MESKFGVGRSSGSNPDKFESRGELGSGPEWRRVVELSSRCLVEIIPSLCDGRGWYGRKGGGR